MATSEAVGSERVYRRDRERFGVWIVGTLLTIVSGVGGWLWLRAVNTIDDLDTRVRAVEQWRGVKDEADRHRDGKLSEIRDDVKELLRRSRP